jgi:hypothetical protein
MANIRDFVPPRSSPTATSSSADSAWRLHRLGRRRLRPRRDHPWRMAGSEGSCGLEGAPDSVGSIPGVLVLPNSEDCPSGRFEQHVRLVVALNVSAQFQLPPLGVGAWLGGMSGTAVPEASVDEDSHAAAGENDVGRTSEFGNRSTVDPIAEALGMKKPSDQYLRKGIPGRLTTHPLARRGVSLQARGAASLARIHWVR